MAKQKTIPDKMYFRIGEVAELLAVKPYVLRYWETEFSDIKPVKSQSKQRLYKRRDVEMLVVIKRLLYDEKYTINGARQHLKDMMRQQAKGEVAAPTPPPAAKGQKASAKGQKAAALPVDARAVLSKLKNDLHWCISELRK